MVVLLVSLARRAYHFQQSASSSTPFHECRTYYLKSGIADRMLLSNKTISTYKTRLLEKLNARTLVDLIEISKRNHII
ncbi:LuxR C-terminal-related transcriptional regulator [Shewanella chilikensis]|uniref:LuxR C-terminal-related transcriptional regulator n=1 Tax=Shewanella chilikensis TaxID=558541 RepID=UPI0023FA1C5C|nr:LuxR C-terminal-related transcriptional regulator [Shewanella chilikensis]